MRSARRELIWHRGRLYTGCNFIEMFWEERAFMFSAFIVRSNKVEQQCYRSIQLAGPDEQFQSAASETNDFACVKLLGFSTVAEGFSTQ